jgi:hypothetical protein
MPGPRPPQLLLPAPPTDATAAVAPAPVDTPLPRPLAPWRAWLDWLPPEQIAALGDLLPRLDAALGALRGPRLQQGEEPVGIDDLRRRGPYHRLLLSEWAVADVAPDEFLRRASSGEHLFLSPRREVRKADARIVALFDSGPAQLGAPRLAHVALWILLARRAAAAQLQFGWGTLAAPPRLHPADQPQQLKAFLATRTFAHPDAAALAAWREALADDRRTPGERWRIGDADTPVDAADFTHRVSVRREDGATLAVRIEASGALREVRLPLPDGRAAAQLLRGRFAFEHMALPADDAAPAHDGPRLSLRQPPLIAPGGQRIAVPLLDASTAMLYTLPKDGGCTPKPTRSANWARGRELLCATLGKSFGGVIADPEHLHFWNIPGFRVQPRPAKDDFQAPPGQAHWLPCALLAGGGQPDGLYVLDSARRLVRFTGESRRGRGRTGVDTIARDVLAIAPLDAERLAYVHRDAQRTSLRLHHRSGRGDVMVHQLDTPRMPTQAFLRVATFGTGAWAMSAGGQREGGHWVIVQRNSMARPWTTTQHRLGAGWRACGLAIVPGTRLHGLVALSPDRRRIVLFDGADDTVLHHADAPIATVSVGVDCDVIAAVTERRQLVVITPGGAGPLAWSDDDGVPDAD